MNDVVNDVVVTSGLFDGERFLSGGWRIAFDGERIARVSRCDATDESNGGSSGSVAIPALIDAHVHLCLDASRFPVEHFQDAGSAEIIQLASDHARMAIRAGVTTVRDCGSPLAMVGALREECQTHPDEWPHLVLAGMPVTTVGGHCHFLADSVPNDEAVTLRELVGANVDFVKVMLTGGGLTKGSDPRRLQFDAPRLKRIVQLAEKDGLYVAAHSHTEESLVLAAQSGVRTIEHGTGLREDGVGLDRRIAAEIAKHGTFVVPTLAGFIIACRRRIKGVQKGLAEVDQEQLIHQRLAAVEVLHSEGVRLVAGTDAGSRLLPFDLIGEELRSLQDVGLTASEALAAGTSTAASALGLNDCGRIAEGAIADLSIVSGSDLETVLENVEKPLRVFRGGMEIFNCERLS